MVCVPCFIIPILLYIWHKFIQPILLRYWNPWEKKDAEGKVIKPEFPFECKGGVCPYPGAKNKKQLDNSNTDEATTSNINGATVGAAEETVTANGSNKKDD